jgi:hypothetical protein
VAALDERSAGTGPPSWLSYVTVADVDAAGTRVRELGGSQLSDPFDVLDAGRMVVARDPQGAVFALWQAGRHIGAGRVNDVGCFCWNELETTDPRRRGPRALRGRRGRLRRGGRTAMPSDGRSRLRR